MDVGGNWEVNVVLIEETLNLLPRLRNALSQGSRSLEYLLCAEQSSCHFHVSLQISWFLFLNYFKTRHLPPPKKKNFFTHNWTPNSYLSYSHPILILLVLSHASVYTYGQSSLQRLNTHTKYV